jgi:hypothetical protein
MLTFTMQSVLETTLRDEVCQWLAAGRWLSSTNKTDCHDITEILLKVALNTLTLPFPVYSDIFFCLIGSWYRVQLIIP